MVSQFLLDVRVSIESLDQLGGNWALFLVPKSVAVVLSKLVLLLIAPSLRGEGIKDEKAEGSLPSS